MILYRALISFRVVNALFMFAQYAIFIFFLFQQISQAFPKGYRLACPQDEGVNRCSNKNFGGKEEVDILDIVREKVGEGHCEGGN